MDRACQAFHLSTILPTLASGAHLTILVLTIWDGFFGIWYGVFDIRDVAFGKVDFVFDFWESLFEKLVLPKSIMITITIDNIFFIVNRHPN